VAEAAEQVRQDRDIAGHAELIAIRLACGAIDSLDLSACTLYTNVEPCWMCSYAIREARIATVVIGAPIDDIGGATSRFPILTDPDIADWVDPPIVRWTPTIE
jgi:tRNA(adenine34) deaminase